METFEITEDHLKLVKRMYVSWGDMEYGAPEVNGKRPYGNGDVAQDIAEILGWYTQEQWDDEDFTEALWEDEEFHDRARKIHEEMENVLQICFYFLTFETGKYQREETWERWEKV